MRILVEAPIGLRDAHVVEQRDRYRRRLERLGSVLATWSGLDVPMPTGGFYLWFDAGDGWAFAEQLAKDVESRYVRMVRDELTADVHGEVDEASWRIKQTLRRGKSATANRNFPKYTRQSFIDTLTLYLHGICCDIDVDTGPRQLPSRFLRKRLVLLSEAYPPPQGYTVFPEQ